MQRKVHEPRALLLLLLTMYICMVTHIVGRVSVDQPGKVAIPARGQLSGGNCSRLRIWSRDTGSAVVPSRVSLLISILRLNLYSNNMKTEQQMPTRQARTRTIYENFICV